MALPAGGLRLLGATADSAAYSDVATPIIKSGTGDAAFRTPTEQSVALADTLFSHEVAQGLPSLESSQYLSQMEASTTAEESEIGRFKTSDAEIASLFSRKGAVNPSTGPALSPSTLSHHRAGAQGGNAPTGNSPNTPGTNALAGMGAGVGGTSTGASSVGGGSSGATGGGAAGTVNQLNALGIRGAFTSQAIASNVSATPAMNPADSPATSGKEGSLYGGLLATFTDPTGNPNNMDQYSGTGPPHEWWTPS